MNRTCLTIGRAVLAALVFSAGAPSGIAAAQRRVEPTLEVEAAWLTPRPVQAAPDPDLRTKALARQFPWITRFWAELRGEERARAERAFRRRGQTEEFDLTWDKMGLRDRVLLLFGPGRARAD